MFSLDTKKLSLVIEKFNLLINGEHLKKLLGLIDVISKWVSVVMVQCSNAPLVLKLLDFFSNFLEKFTLSSFNASDHEAYEIIAMLFNRLSSSNSLVKNKAKVLMSQAFMICECSKVLQIVAEILSTTKNIKSVAPCLEELTNLL